MMLVSCSLGRSGGEGLGLFAVAPIAAGTVVWRFDHIFGFLVPRTALAAASAGTRAFFDCFADGVASYPELTCGSRHLATEAFVLQPHRAPQ